MTYWYTAYCEKCKSHSPPLFVSSMSKISLYPFSEDVLKKSHDWVEEHAFHNPIILHEDDSKTPVGGTEVQS